MLSIHFLGEDPEIRDALTRFTTPKGYIFKPHSQKQTLLREMPFAPATLIILAPSPKQSWNLLGLAAELRTLAQNIPIILLNDQSTEAQVLAALKLHVNDYFKYPVAVPELLASLENMTSALSPASIQANGSLNLTSLDYCALVGNSQSMQSIRQQLAQIAATDSTVLITGETGTGKELLAHLIHRGSKRHHKPIICLNCAAVPDSLLEGELFGFEKGAFTGAHAFYEGKLKLAEGGTVFFDEIGDMSLNAQAKLLQVIESKEVYRLRGRQQVTLDIRIIAATNQNLETLQCQGRFRSDLYYRLNVAAIELPPLRQRKEDLPLLMDHFIGHFNRLFGRTVQACTPEAMELLLRYAWPGNIRELRNLCEATFINLSSSSITTADLPATFRHKIQAQDSTRVTERDLLLSTLLATNWNKTDTARKLHWSRPKLYRKMAKFNIQVCNDKKMPDKENVTLMANV